MLDALTRCSTIAVDKTGTLTTGTLSCVGMMNPLNAGEQPVDAGEPSCCTYTVSHSGVTPCMCEKVIMLPGICLHASLPGDEGYVVRN